MKRQLLISVLICQLLCQIPRTSFAQTPLPNPPEQRRANPPPSEPQQPARPGDEDTVRITTNLVQVDAVVTDKSGKPVTDLNPEEMQILEDGKPQKITNLSYVALDVPADSKPAEPSKPVDKNAPPVPPIRLRPDQVHRTMALVVDDLGLSFESVSFVRRALKKFLDQQMQPNDLVAIMRTSGGIGALQQFTTDKRQLYAAVEKVRWNPSGRGGVSAIPRIEPPALPESPVPSRSSGEDETTAAENLDQFREDLFAVGTLGTLNYIVKGLREMPGRKSVVLISDGFKIFSRSEPTGSDRILMALRQLTDLANRASVVIYTMDASGLQTLALTAADSTNGMSAEAVEQSLSNRRSDFFESQSGLDYLALQTGGIAIRNNNDLNAGIKRVIDDQRGYYLIGYRPDEGTFDRVSGRRKFHKLSLKVKRPGKFNVRMRNGFYGVTDEDFKPSPVAQTRAQQMIRAITSPFGSAGVRVRLTSLFADDPKLGSIMRSIVHVNAGDLTFTNEPDDWHHAVFDVLAITFGDNGTVIDQISRTQSMRVKGKTYEQVVKNGFTYSITVPVKKPGAYQLRTALRDSGTERVGSASQFIEVPDLKKNRLALSGIMIKGMSPQAFEQSVAGAAQKEELDEAFGESDPNTSMALRRFKQGLVMIYALVAYNAQLDKTTGKPQLKTQVRVFLDGKPVFTGSEIPFDLSKQLDLKRLQLAGAIQLGSAMVPGEYVVQVLVTDALAKEKHRVASQWINFEIVK
jgi:VWFA-related protein